MKKTIKIETERFLLRILTEDDVTEEYLAWLKDVDAKQFIVSATHTNGLPKLKQYVREKMNQDNILFFGIFNKIYCQHIGNIKYEPVNTKLGYAIMGILIGEPEYRGKGVTTEVLQESAIWMRDNCNINEIVLGVNTANKAAIHAYKKTGFIVSETPYIKNMSDTISMVWNLEKSSL